MTSFAKINKPFGLQASIYTSVVEDDLCCLWFASDGGLVRFCENRYSVFNYLHGIPSPTFTHYSAHKDLNGVLWIENAKGLLYVNPDLIVENDRKKEALEL